MKIIVVGVGTIGTYITELLSMQDNDLLVIDNDKSKLAIINEKYDVKTVCGNAVNLSFLKSLSIENADLFVAVTADDAVNLISSLTAKTLGVKKTISRVRNKEFVEGRISNENQNDFFGIDLVFCPENVSAEEIAKRIKTPGISAIEFFAKDRVLMREFCIKDTNPFLKTPFKNLKFGHSVLVVAIYRNDNIIIPDGDSYFLEGDRVFIIGDKKSIYNIGKYFDEIEIKRKKIIISGGGGLGFELAKLLENENFEIKLIEQDMKRCKYLSSELHNVSIVNGSSVDTNILKEEGVNNTDTYIAVSENDDDNLLSAITAKLNGAKETIVVMYRNDYMPIAKMLGIDTIINPMIVTASTVLSFIMKDKMKTVAVLTDEKAKIIELEVNEKCSIIDKPFHKVKLPKNTIFGAIVRVNEIIIPHGNNCLKLKDTVIVVTLQKNISYINNIFY